MKMASGLFVIALSIAVSDVLGHTICQDRNLSITVDNIMELYIDGQGIQNLPNYNDWTKADVVPLTCSAKVIAVKGIDRGVVAGILASTDDGYVQTNSSWKCTSVYYDGWQNEGFDDSAWPAAYQAGIHQTSPWRLVPGIRTDVYWIWTPRYTGGDLIVYCRRRLTPSVTAPVCTPRTLSITVDNYLRLYFNGIEQSNLPNANNWRRSDSVALPCNTQVIAVQGTDDGAVRAGILASTADGYLLTNGSWKCTNVYYRGWESVGYDDSAWPAAYVIAIHQTSPWSLVRPIRTDAYWIWTPRYINGDRVVYCRRKLTIQPAC